MKWGLIGCGDVCEHKGGPSLYKADGSSLVAVMSRNKDRASGFAKRHGADRYYTRLEDLLADKDVEAVYVATPPNVHAEQVIACAKAGKHILCEKPMGLTLRECDGMIDAVRQHNVQMMLAYYRRGYPAVVQVKKLLDEKRIGRPTKIRTEVAFPFKLNPNRSWLVDASVAGGGFLWDIGSHRIDLMLFLMGDITEVAAFVDTVAYDFDVDDSTVMITRFQNGAQGTGIYHWNVTCGGDEIEVGGTEGRIVCEMNKGRVQLFTAKGEEEWILPPPVNTHRAIVENFIQSIQQKRRNCVDGIEGRKTNVVIDAAILSNREGRTVKINL